jgi:hypothetical protein
MADRLIFGGEQSNGPATLWLGGSVFAFDRRPPQPNAGPNSAPQ